MSNALLSSEQLASPFIELDDRNARDWNDFAEAQGWGDGLPLLPPTEEDVQAMLRHHRSSSQPLPALPPRGIVPTPASIAANAVMAGCRPELYPFLVTALRGTVVDGYNLHGTLATTHACGNMILVSGPGAKRVGLNAAGNCFGQGTRANATLGRALQLCMVNLGGARPGTLDRSTLGNPAKYSFCFAENEDATPWEAYRLRHGFAAGDTVVTVVAAEGPHNINDHGSKNGDELINTVAWTMSQPGSNNICGRGPCFVVLGPEHAALMHRDGWTVATIQEAIHERSRVHCSRLSKGIREDGVMSAPRGEYYYLTPTPQDIHVVVAGGAGKHSAYISSFGITKVVSLVVPEDGAAV